MIPLAEYTKEQYGFVQSSRKALLVYCKTMTPEDLFSESTAFGNGSSIRNLLVHIVNTYEYWIARCVLKKQIAFSKRENQNNIEDVIKLFDHVDAFMAEFMQHLEIHPEEEVEFQINGVKNTAQPFKLFSHVITHEYHHKGQVLSLSRHLGYTPVDTDIMR